MACESASGPRSSCCGFGATQENLGYDCDAPPAGACCCGGESDGGVGKTPIAGVVAPPLLVRGRPVVIPPGVDGGAKTALVGVVLAPDVPPPPTGAAGMLPLPCAGALIGPD